MVAGALGSVITMPFDVLKTKMQGLNANRRHAAPARAWAHAWRTHGAWPPVLGSPPLPPPHPPPSSHRPTRYTSTLHCLKTIVREEGVLVLYSGLGARLGRAAPRHVETRPRACHEPVESWGRSSGEASCTVLAGPTHTSRGSRRDQRARAPLALPRLLHCSLLPTRRAALQCRPYPCDGCKLQVPGQGIIFASYEVFSRFVTSSLSFFSAQHLVPKKKEGR